MYIAISLPMISQTNFAYLYIYLILIYIFILLGRGKSKENQNVRFVLKKAFNQLGFTIN